MGISSRSQEKGKITIKLRPDGGTWSGNSILPRSWWQKISTANCCPTWNNTFSTKYLRKKIINTREKQQNARLLQGQPAKRLCFPKRAIWNSLLIDTFEATKRRQCMQPSGLRLFWGITSSLCGHLLQGLKILRPKWAPNIETRAPSNSIYSADAEEKLTFVSEILSRWRRIEQRKYLQNHFKWCLKNWWVLFWISE